MNLLIVPIFLHLIFKYNRVCAKVSCYNFLVFLLNTKNFNDKKLKGAINGIGISFAIFGSRPAVIKPFRIIVPKLQKKTVFIKYLLPALLWSASLVNDQK